METVLYRRWLSELWHGDYRAADELIGEEFVGHWPDTNVHGKEGLLTMIGRTRNILTHLRFDLVIPPFSERDLVAVRWVGRGETQDGPVTLVGNDILVTEHSGAAGVWTQQRDKDALVVVMPAPRDRGRRKTEPVSAARSVVDPC